MLKEPVERWRNVNGHNLLQLMYEVKKNTSINQMIKNRTSMEFLLYSVFVGIFCPPGSGFAFPMRNRIQRTKINTDLDPADQPMRHPSDRRSLQPSKKNIQHFKTWIFFSCASFLPSLIRVRIQRTKINADPDPKPAYKNLLAFQFFYV